MIRIIALLSVVFLFGFGIPSGPVKGEKAPNFELISPDGKKIQLSDLKGKVVLIDFWASWCRPCRMENPNLVDAYQKYKKSKFTVGKGFEIYSVSLDRNADAWKKGIETDGLVWKNHGWDQEGKIAAAYQVRSIPSAFLIDGEGTIIAAGDELRGMGLHLQLDRIVKQ